MYFRNIDILAYSVYVGDSRFSGEQSSFLRANEGWYLDRHQAMWNIFIMPYLHSESKYQIHTSFYLTKHTTTSTAHIELVGKLLQFVVMKPYEVLTF